MVLLAEMFLADTGRALAEEALVGRTSLAESGVACVLGVIAKSKVEFIARLDSPMKIVGVWGVIVGGLWRSDDVGASSWFTAMLTYRLRCSLQLFRQLQLEDWKWYKLRRWKENSA